jgi:hypothetical protein
MHLTSYQLVHLKSIKDSVINSFDGDFSGEFVPNPVISASLIRKISNESHGIAETKQKEAVTTTSD